MTITTVTVEMKVSLYDVDLQTRHLTLFRQRWMSSAVSNYRADALPRRKLTLVRNYSDFNVSTLM